LLGVFGWVMRKLGFSLAPVILGFVLGGLFENNLRRALSISGGDWTILVTSWNSVALYILTIAIIAVPLVYGRYKASRAEGDGGEASDAAKS
ncbi:tripartite tricarboxylate transporter permease, partial [Fulvimarina sp. MAC3]